MKFQSFGNKENPCIVLLHGGGLSWWSLGAVANELKQDYHLILPIIDGHGQDHQQPFCSIEDSAAKLLAHLQQEGLEKIFLLAGLSIGAQITLEVLCQKNNLAEYCILESALVRPSESIKKMSAALMKAAYPLIRKEWFAKLQAKSLFVPEDLIDTYYHESSLISRQTLINLVSSNAMYALKEQTSAILADTLIIYGSREFPSMKKSAELIHDAIPKSHIHVAHKMGHGELSQQHPFDYLHILREHIKNKQ